VDKIFIWGTNMSDQFERVIVIVLDGVGVGEAPDAAEYGDEGSNSIGNTARVVGGLDLSNLGELGLGNLTPVAGVPSRRETAGGYGKMREASAGKDSVTGHWELMGLHLTRPFPTYPQGFPPAVLEEFKRRTGKNVLGNKPASGTVIIKELGEEHIRTGMPIVYTSADSVFQIAAHEEIIPIPELYAMCEAARDMLRGEHAVGRVIARPFIGTNAENFTRTPRRKDYAVKPPRETVMTRLQAAGKKVFATGKIDDLFGQVGIDETHHTVDNDESVRGLLKFLERDFSGLIFSNLIEFDMIYGHRNDPQGYASRLETFDRWIPTIREKMRPGDVAMIVADHGVDPTTASTDHSREYIPLLVFGPRVKGSIDLGIRKTFADVGATISEIFGLPDCEIGISFLKQIVESG
jgi:phosphopentomutase